MREPDFSKKKIDYNVSPLNESSQKCTENSNKILQNNNYLGYSFINEENNNMDQSNRNLLNIENKNFNSNDHTIFPFNFNQAQASFDPDFKVMPEEKALQNQSYLNPEQNYNKGRLNLKAKLKASLKLPIISKSVIGNKNNANNKIIHNINPKFQLAQMQREKKLMDEVKLNDIIQKEKKELEKVYRSISDAHRKQQIVSGINNNQIVGNENKIELTRNFRREFQPRIHPFKYLNISTPNSNLNYQRLINERNGSIVNYSNNMMKLAEDKSRQLGIVIDREEKEMKTTTPKILELKNQINFQIKNSEIVNKLNGKEEKRNEKVKLKDKDLNNEDEYKNLNNGIQNNQKGINNNNNLKKLITSRLSELSAQMYKMHSVLEGQIKEIELEGNKYEESKSNESKQVSDGFCKGNATENVNNKPSPGSQDCFTLDGKVNSRRTNNYSPLVIENFHLNKNEKEANQKYNQLNQKTPNYLSYKHVVIPFDYSMIQNQRNNRDSYTKKKMNTNADINNADKRDAFSKLDSYDHRIKQYNVGNNENRYFNIEKINLLNTNRLTTLKKYECLQPFQNDNYVNLNKGILPNVKFQKLNTIQY